MRPWLHLARVSNLPTVWTNVAAAWLLASGHWNDARLSWLILAGSLLYTGGMILNDAADLSFDRVHRQERPLPSGQVSVTSAWCVGIGMLLVGAGVAWMKGGAQPLCIAGLVLCILFYDLYHKPWAGSVIVMGACRTLLVCMAGSALLLEENAAGKSDAAMGDECHCSLDALCHLPSLVLLYGCALGIYTVALSVAARSGGKSRACWLLWTPALPFLWGASAGLKHSGFVQNVALLIVPLIFALIIISALWRLRHGRIDAAVGLLLAGFVVVDALALCHTQPALALVFVALAPFLRLWQRWVAAT